MENPVQLLPPNDGFIGYKIGLPALKANGQPATKEQTLFVATAPVVGGVSVIDNLSSTEIKATSATLLSKVITPDMAGTVFEGSDCPVLSAEGGDQRLACWMENDE